VQGPCLDVKSNLSGRWKWFSSDERTESSNVYPSTEAAGKVQSEAALADEVKSAIASQEQQLEETRGKTPEELEDERILDSLRLETFTPKEGVEIARRFSRRKFVEGLDIVLDLKLDPKKADQQIRKSLRLPHGTGKKRRIAVFAKGDKSKEALDAGADMVGDTDLLETIQNMKKIQKKIDVIMCTPDQMSVVRQAARMLGPKGLMPNPKLGTVTEDLAELIPVFATHIVPARTDKFGQVHARIGSMAFTDEQLLENIRSFMVSIIESKPEGAKGNFIKSVHLTTTMGPSIQIDLPYISPVSNLFMRDTKLPVVRKNR